MRFKNIFNLCLSSLVFSSCYYNPNRDVTNENIIGDKLANISTLQNIQGEQSQSIIMFDPTIKKVHHFDLQSMNHKAIWSVSSPSQKHYIMYVDPMPYFISLTEKSISIQKLNSSSAQTLFSFVGRPLSAAFNATKNLLVTYDDLQTINILKLDEAGNVEFNVSYGGLLEGAYAVQSGDLTANGDLVLATVNRSPLDEGTYLAILTLDNMKKLSGSSSQFQPFTFIKINLKDVKWVAPIPGNADLVFLCSENKLSIYDIKARKEISAMNTSDWYISKYSKSKDPHVIMFKNDNMNYPQSSNREMQIFYVEGNAIKVKSTFTKIVSISSSYLDIVKNNFSLTSHNSSYSNQEGYWLNDVKTQRFFHKYRFTDFLVKSEISIADQAEVAVGEDFIFNLYPSELGMAEKIDTNDKSIKTLRSFNISEIK